MTQGHKYGKSKSWKKIFHENNNQKRARVAKPISEKIDFKTKIVTRDKEVQFIIVMIKGSTLQEDMTITNIYTLNNREPKYISKNQKN